MKRLVVLALVSLTVALAATTTAGARTTATPTEKRLQKQLGTLTKQVTALTKTVNTLKKDLDDTANYAFAVFLLSECNSAITADALQGTWTVIDQISVATQAGKTYFGPQTPVDDKGVCAGALGVNRSQVSPPNVDAYKTMLGFLPQTAALARNISL
jgi:hypothetical protein